MKSARLYLAGLGLAVVAVPLGAWIWWSQASAPPQPTGSRQPVEVQIGSGTSANQIGHELERAGLIRSITAWKLWSRWLMLQGRGEGFQAGVYRLSPDQSLGAIAQTIWAGDVVQASLTIPEGWNLRQMAKSFEAKGYFKAEDFLRAASDIPYDRYSWLPPNLPHLEGFLFPDTYQFPTGSVTPEAVIAHMLDRFEQAVLPLYQNRQSQTQLSLREWVTLASIVEKEAVIPAERPRIAGVFSQRLQQGIPLGADPTVEYSLGIQQTPDKPLTLVQVNTPSVYNTYLNAGLPPTPIASPGIASLKAALAPERTDYLYFMARYDGTHIFSRTLEEHQTAQARIQDGRAQ